MQQLETSDGRRLQDSMPERVAVAAAVMLMNVDDDDHERRLHEPADRRMAAPNHAALENLPNFLAPLVTEIWRGSQNKKWALLISPDTPSGQIFICSHSTCKCLPAYQI